MRKVRAICVYKDNRIYNLTALHKDTDVALIHYDLEDTKITPCPHDSFEEMYKDVLEVLKSNNMYCGYYTDFNKRCYNISFIDLNNPTEVNRYYV